jgi:hypothetical protein
MACETTDFRPSRKTATGNLWIGTTSGISRWNGSRFENYYLEQGLSYGWVRAIVQDRNGDMLIGTDRGINRFHDGRFVADAAFEQLRHDRVWSIFPMPKEFSGSVLAAQAWFDRDRLRWRESPPRKVCSATRSFRFSAMLAASFG